MMELRGCNPTNFVINMFMMKSHKICVRSPYTHRMLVTPRAYKKRITPRRLMNDINRMLYKMNDDPIFEAMLSESSTIAGIQLSMVMMYGVLYLIDNAFFAEERRKNYPNKI